MPTVEDCQELVDNCTGEWTSLNGVNGYLFTSNINGATIFFPSSGRFDGTTIKAPGGGCYYWTSDFDNASNAKFLHLSSSTVNPEDTYYRYLGFVIRAVQDGTPNRSIVLPTPEDEPKEEETPTEEEPKDDNQR